MFFWLFIRCCSENRPEIFKNFNLINPRIMAWYIHKIQYVNSHSFDILFDFICLSSAKGPPWLIWKRPLMKNGQPRRSPRIRNITPFFLATFRPFLRAFSTIFTQLAALQQFQPSQTLLGNEDDVYQSHSVASKSILLHQLQYFHPVPPKLLRYLWRGCICGLSQESAGREAVPRCGAARQASGTHVGTSVLRDPNLGYESTFAR